MKVHAVAALKAFYPFHLLLEIADLRRSTYYDHLTRLDRPDRHADLNARIAAIFAASHQRYGHRRIHACLHKEGYRVAKKTVLARMRAAGLVCVVRRKRRRPVQGAVGVVAPNLLNRQFSALAPNQCWVTDITEFRVRNHRVYLATMMDLFDRQILAYRVGFSPSLDLTNGMLTDALATLPPGKAPMVHSDQGFQFRHLSWQHLLATVGATQSMSRKGTCLDNAMMENFFGHLKAEFFHPTTFSDVGTFVEDLHAYMVWYNHDRISLSLHGMSPIHYRAHARAAS